MKPFRKNFSEIFCKPRLSSCKTCEISAYSLQFFSVSVLHWKNSHKYFRILFCTQVRRHVHKKIRERRYWKEKPGRFVFGKPILFALILGLTVSYSLGILVWNFYHTFVIVSIEFWLRFETQTRPTRFAIIYYSSLPGLKGRFVCVWNCLIFFQSEYSSVWPEICRVLCQIQWRFLRGISGWNHFGRIFQKFFCKPRLSSTETCEISPYFLKFYSAAVLRRKNSHKYLHCLLYTSPSPRD